MRRRRSKSARLIVVVLAAAFAAFSAATLNAQTGVPNEGAPELLLPIGARTIAMGLAAVATASGTDGLWWNPATVSRGPREVALDIGHTFGTIGGGADAGAAVVFPVRGVGAFGFTLRYISEGQTTATDTFNIPIGALSVAPVVLGATFAAPFGDRFAAGIGVKLYQVIYSCTGTCNQPSTPRTGAVDVGAEYFLTKDSIVTVGAAVQNVGYKLQQLDAPQADAIPSRFDVGIAFAPKLAQLPKEARLRVASDIVTRIGGGRPGSRFGGELSWLDKVQVRAGYILNSASGSGPSVGLGFATERLRVDFAQLRTDLAAQTGTPPTFLSLRYVF